MNYTKPNDEDYQDKPEDWLLGALVFGKAVGIVIPENCGVVVDLVGDMIDLYPLAKRVIVFNKDGQVGILEADERTDLVEGDLVQLIDEDNIKN
jgi:hypothetical protein